MAIQKRFVRNHHDVDEYEAVHVLQLLTEDHRTVEQLFASFDEADGRARQGIADDALHAVEVHSAIEEKLVYPAIRKATGEEDLVDEAAEEHHVVKFMIKELHKMKASVRGYRAKFTVLSELVRHHMIAEESEMFPKAEQSGVDWHTLGREALKMKDRMMKSSRRHRRAA